MFLTAIWVLMAAIGVAASAGVLSISLNVMHFLKRNPRTQDLAKSYRIEILQNTILFCVQALNLSIGLIGIIATAQGWTKGLVAVVATIGLFLVALLLTSLSLINYWFRVRTQLGA